MSKKENFSSLLNKKSTGADEQKKHIKQAHSDLFNHEEEKESRDQFKKTKNVKFEDRFTRQTFYIENELLEQLNKEAGKEKGEKTRIINGALKDYLN